MSASVPDTASTTDRSFWLGVWRVADPRFTLASVASILLGAAAAAHDGALAWDWLAVTFVGVFCVEAATNAAGEALRPDEDDESERDDPGERGSPSADERRVLEEGLMSRGQLVLLAAGFYALAAAVGLLVVVEREADALWLGLVGVSLALAYHVPPLRLSHRGLGELTVALTYGPILCCGTYLVQRHAVTPEVALLSVPLGLLIGGFLLVSEFSDRWADAAAGRRTLVVRLGAQRAATAFGVVVRVAFGMVALLPFLGLPLGVLGGLAGLPHAVAAWRRLQRPPQRDIEIAPAHPWSLMAFVLLSAGASVGLLLS